MRSTRRPKIRKSITPSQFRNFIFGGRSVFTLENKGTGSYITFKIREIKKKGKVVPNQFAVNMKSLGDNDSGYSMLGFLDIKKPYFKAWGHVDRNHVGYKTLYWLLRNLESLENFEDLVIYHEGACCKCSMPLTTPESIDKGIGPVCLDRMLSGSINTLKDLNLWNDSLSYDDNIRAALKVDPTVWSKVHVPDYIKIEDVNKGHRLLGRLGIL